MTISATQPPVGVHSHVHAWERGVDPWHADAFAGTPAEGRFVADTPRRSGWYALDWCGNVIGFIADGTEYEESSSEQ